MYEVIAFNSRERRILYLISTHFEHIYFLNGVSNEAGLPIFVAVAMCCIKLFEEHLVNNGIHYSLLPNQSMW